jgi:hypothetical protein
MDRQLLGGERQKVVQARAETELPDGRVLVIRPVTVGKLTQFEEIVIATLEETSVAKLAGLWLDALELAGEISINGKPVKRDALEAMDAQTIGQCFAALVGVVNWSPFGGEEPEVSEPTAKPTPSRKASRG